MYQSLTAPGGVDLRHGMICVLGLLRVALIAVLLHDGRGTSVGRHHDYQVSKALQFLLVSRNHQVFNGIGMPCTCLMVAYEFCLVHCSVIAYNLHLLAQKALV